MSYKHPYGEQVSILSFTDTNQIIIDNEEIDRLFNHSEIQNRKIVILSMIGAFRGGKSFFLDYCLRFLYAHVSINREIVGITSISQKQKY